MEEILTQSKSATSYYQNMQNNYYENARIRERNNILNKMQQQYENYSSNTNTISQEIPSNFENNAPQQENVANNNNNNNPLNNALGNLNLSNISSLLSGGNFQNVLLNLLSKENGNIGNILKLMQNPMIKNTFSKKHNKTKPASTFGDNIETKSEIDNYEKIKT